MKAEWIAFWAICASCIALSFGLVLSSYPLLSAGICGFFISGIIVGRITKEAYP